MLMPAPTHFIRFCLQGKGFDAPLAIYFDWISPSQICLNVSGKSDALAAFDELFDMPEQAQLREDCQALVGESCTPFIPVHTRTHSH